MLTNELTSLSGRDPIPGARASLYESFDPAEMVAAIAAGTGPGVPNRVGTLVPGVIEAGHWVMMDTNGNFVLATSPDLSSALSIMCWFVATGDNDTGVAARKMNCVHGGFRAVTTKFDTAQSYTKGVPLIVSAGILTPKILGDNKQIVAYVGTEGSFTGSDGETQLLDIFGAYGAPRY